MSANTEWGALPDITSQHWSNYSQSVYIDPIEWQWTQCDAPEGPCPLQMMTFVMDKFNQLEGSFVGRFEYLTFWGPAREMQEMGGCRI